MTNPQNTPKPYRCYACGEAENTDAHCDIDVFTGEPTQCPISGDEADWLERKLTQNTPADEPCKRCGGSGEVPTGVGEDGRDFDGTSPEIIEPCPDCPPEPEIVSQL